MESALGDVPVKSSISFAHLSSVFLLRTCQVKTRSQSYIHGIFCVSPSMLKHFSPIFDTIHTWALIATYFKRFSAWKYYRNQSVDSELETLAGLDLALIYFPLFRSSKATKNLLLLSA